MKFVALAVAIFLVAGCQARNLQADAPSHYEQIRAAVVTHLNQAKANAEKAIERIDDPEYKARLTQSLENVQKFLESTSESLAPFRGGLGPQIVDGIADLRQRVAGDLEKLHTELEPKLKELREVVEKHLKEYQAELDPLIKEYTEENNKKLAEVRKKIKATLGKLEEKLKVNLEETKKKLTPIVEILRDKLTARVEELRATLGPYVQEYKEQIEATINNLRAKYESGELQKRVTTMVEEIKPQLSAVAETIGKVFKD